MRAYEWRGIVARVAALAPPRRVDALARRGLRHRRPGALRARRRRLRRRGPRGGLGARAAARGGRAGRRPRRTSTALAGSFDVVTAIEVIEHVPDPMGFLRAMRRAAAARRAALPHDRQRRRPPRGARRLELRDPRDPRQLLRAAHARPRHGAAPASARVITGFGPGHADIIRFKVLKNLRVTHPLALGGRPAVERDRARRRPPPRRLRPPGGLRRVRRVLITGGRRVHRQQPRRPAAGRRRRGRRLRQLRHRPAALRRGRSRPSARGEVVEGDVLDAAALREAMAGCDTVFHMAANADVRFGLEDPSRDFEQNTVGTFTVLEAMRAAGRAADRLRLVGLGLRRAGGGADARGRALPGPDLALRAPRSSPARR